MARRDILSDRALGRATMARQMLLKREARGIEETVAHLIGLQGQVGNAPYVGLWTRIEGFERDALTKLILERKLVRVTAMRGTIHLIGAADFLGLFPHTLVVVKRMLSGSWGRYYRDLDLSKVAKAGRKLIEARPMTSAEIGKALQAKWPDRQADALGMAVRSLLPVVHVPPSGTWNKGPAPKLTTAKAWLGREPGEPMPLPTLVWRYLAAFGPASVMDMQAWCGLTKLGAVFESMRGELLSFAGADGRELFDLPEAPRPSEDVEAPVRLMPDYDNIGLGLADRSRFLDPEDYRGVVTGNAFVPAFLVDGRVEGVWNLNARGRAAKVTIKSFRKLGRAANRALTAEGERLAADLAPELPADVVVGQL